MTDLERLQKLEQARRLIREVEFSYHSDDIIRKNIYRAVVQTFGYSSVLGDMIQDLKDRIVYKLSKKDSSND